MFKCLILILTLTFASSAFAQFHTSLAGEIIHSQMESLKKSKKHKSEQAIEVENLDDRMISKIPRNGLHEPNPRGLTTTLPPKKVSSQKTAR